MSLHPEILGVVQVAADLAALVEVADVKALSARLSTASPEAHASAATAAASERVWIDYAHPPNVLVVSITDK